MDGWMELGDRQHDEDPRPGVVYMVWSEPPGASMFANHNNVTEEPWPMT